MADIEQVQLGVIGHTLEIEVQRMDADGNLAARDISGQTALAIIATPPIGSKKTFTASLTNTGSDGKLDYVTAASSDLDESGLWKLQGHITEGGSPITKTEVGFLRVIDNL